MLGNCKVCKKVIDGVVGKREKIYCGKACKQKGWRLLHGQVEVVKRICKWCKKEFEYKNRNGRPLEYCGEGCKETSGCGYTVTEWVTSCNAGRADIIAKYGGLEAACAALDIDFNEIKGISEDLVREK